MTNFDWIVKEVWFELRPKWKENKQTKRQKNLGSGKSVSHALQKKDLKAPGDTLQLVCLRDEKKAYLTGPCRTGERREQASDSIKINTYRIW